MPFFILLIIFLSLCFSFAGFFLNAALFSPCQPVFFFFFFCPRCPPSLLHPGTKRHFKWTFSLQYFFVPFISCLSFLCVRQTPANLGYKSKVSLRASVLISHLLSPSVERGIMWHASVNFFNPPHSSLKFTLHSNKNTNVSLSESCCWEPAVETTWVMYRLFPARCHTVYNRRYCCVCVCSKTSCYSVLHSPWFFSVPLIQQQEPNEYTVNVTDFSVSFSFLFSLSLKNDKMKWSGKKSPRQLLCLYFFFLIFTIEYTCIGHGHG